MALESKEDLVSEIKKSRKYAGLTSEIVEKEVEEFTRKNSRWQEFKPKFILKQIKEKLHKIYGSFQTKKKSKIGKLLEEYENERDNKILRKILSLNVSTRERMGSYGWIYGEIFRRTKDIDTIIDLGCGLNPLSYPYMEAENEIKYYAYDINDHDLEIVREFLNFSRVVNHVEAVNLRDLEKVKKLPPADICLMFKFLDPLELSSKGHKLAEDLVQIMRSKCKYLVISFSTNTISGRPMNHPYRGWIERMLERINLKFESFTTPNEIFYFIRANE